MCDLLIPGLIVAGLIGLTATQSNNCPAPCPQPVYAPAPAAYAPAPGAYAPASSYTYSTQRYAAPARYDAGSRYTAGSFVHGRQGTTVHAGYASQQSHHGHHDHGSAVSVGYHSGY